MIFPDIDFIDFIGFHERPFKHELNLSKVFNDLDRFKGNLKGLQNYMKKWRVSVKEDYKDVDPQGLVVSGWTMCPSLNNKEYITVDLYLHTKSFNDHVFDESTEKHPFGWNRFKYEFCKILAHEFIHVRQAANNGDEFKDTYVSFKGDSDDREYHACRQEIEAYGHCMYLETLWDDFKFKDFKRRMRSTQLYILLLRVYGGDHTCEVISQHKRQAIKWKKKYEALGNS